HHGMDGRVHNDVRALGERLDLHGCRGCAWRGHRVVPGVAPDHDAACRCVDAVGRVTRDVRRAYRADFHVAEGPHDLRLVPWFERADVCKLRGTSGRATLVLRHALRDLAGVDQRIGNVGHELAATHGEAKRRGGIAAAHHIDPLARGEELPAVL